MTSEDWEILGIGPTDDPKVLRKAYARRLREHPPEKDPEGFMRLRAAYERILLELDTSGSSPCLDPIPADPPSSTPPTSANESSPTIRWSSHPLQMRLEMELWTEDHWAVFLGLWSRPGSWSSTKSWEMWLEEIRSRGPEARRILEDRMIGYFGGFFRKTQNEEAMMPAIRQIARSWDWEGRRREMYGRYDRRLVYALIRVARGNGKSRGFPRGGNLERTGEDFGSQPAQAGWGRWVLRLTIAGWLGYFLYQFLA